MKMISQLSMIVVALFAINLGYAMENTESTLSGTKVSPGEQKVKVEVLVFHGVKQCETCEAIKKNTREVVEEKFANPADGKEVVFRIVDFSKPENKEIAEKYEIAWTSVLLVKKDADGQETVENISNFAIKNARTNTEEYRKGLADTITKMLD